MVLVVGIDFGSSLIKAASGDAEFVSPGIMGEYNEGWSGMASDKSWENNLCIHVGYDAEGNLVKQFFGEIARKQSEVKRAITGSGIKNLDHVEMAVKVSMAILAIATGTIDPGVQDVQEIECIATVGVPIATQREKMKNLSQRLKGTKEIVIENDNTKKIIQLRVHVTSCMVVYGPYGSYVQLLQEFKENTAVDAVITDIGFGSAEILSIYDGRPNTLASASIPDLSLETLAHRIALALQDQTGKIIKGLDLMHLLQEGQSMVIIGGERLDISELKSYYVEAIANSLTDEIIDLVSKLPPDARIKYYIFTGDGVDLFWKDLELALYQKNLIQDMDQAAHPKDYRIANARGFEFIATSRFKKTR
ncbi:hypothetical protein GF325_18045 [Candidatus Bathyarchaeota archaeon]|nr:hypothetical protein [Candidatus Bathyarchaeota archaeon]